MNASQHRPAVPPSDGNEILDPRTAAGLMEQTGRKARRELTHGSPLLSVMQAVVVLVIYGALWFSVRGQHPYQGPSLSVVGVVYILVAVSALIAVSAYFRAIAGVSGRSRTEDKVSAIPFVVCLVAVYVFVGALYHDGFSHAVAYGVVDAAAPWLVVGAVLGGLAAARQDWRKLTGALAMVVCGTAASFTGANNVWGVLGVLGCALLLARGVLQVFWARRA